MDMPGGDADAIVGVGQNDMHGVHCTGADMYFPLDNSRKGMR